uniref:NADH-ubiquinone oxidoreductase chain 5 n=1 Tax=Coralliophila richardi TaxID=2991502 RepID=A0A9E8JW51_9CAEN|nr:NADH dehydrogenase subunit 5 [Coralliophila richardi]UZT26957.1 NADH dehydrogenase subunit 5 [Coralliophila richardi]
MFKKLKACAVSSTFLLMYSGILVPIAVIFIFYDHSVILEWKIIQISSCFMSFVMIFDPVSLSFSGVVGLIAGCVMMFSSSYMSHDPFLSRFTWLVMLFVLSMNLLIFIPSLPALLLGWDGLGIISFVLVIYYQNMKSLSAGMLTVLANRVGDVMILISIGLLVLEGHWLIVCMWDFYMSAWVGFTVVIAGMTKSAQIPFSSWLPAAMAAPTPVSALVHSSTLVTAGVFLLIRFFNFLAIVPGFNHFLLFISVLTLLMAGISANFENDLKKIIALSTLSQLGVMMMSLSVGMVSLTLFHLYTHALFKALLFLCVGMIIHNSSNTQDIRHTGFLFCQAPLTVSCLNIANLSLCGAPFLSGFYSKDLILETFLFWPMSFLMVLLIFMATGMTAAYSVRLSFCSLWAPMKGPSYHSKKEFDPSVNWAVMILTSFAITSGLLFQAVFLDFKPSVYLLPFSLKSLTTLVIGLGVLFAFLMWDSVSSQKNVGSSQFFCSTMWFLALISTQPLTKQSMLLGTNIMKSIDMGWLEILGGQGTWSMSKMSSFLNQKVQFKAFNFLITLTILWLMILQF